MPNPSLNSSNIVIFVSQIWSLNNVQTINIYWKLSFFEYVNQAMHNTFIES